MADRSRYNPFLILFDLISLMKNSFFFVLYLFVIKYGSDSAFIKYAKIALFLFIGITLVSIILKWFTHKYKMDDTSFHIYKGLFKKSEKTIPFAKIQNVNRRTSLFHRIFKVTSIRFETGIKGMDNAVEFKVISRIEADRIEKLIMNPDTNTSIIIENDQEVEKSFAEATPIKLATARTVHFTPTKRDVLKASFTSFSFLLLIPIIISLYIKIDGVFKIEEKADGLLTSFLNSWWLIGVVVAIIFIASITFGIIRAFFKYGKYEISSDDKQIFILKGVIDESAFTITKNRVQAIVITQSMLKKLLGLAEVKLISTGNFGEEDSETNSLYPFLPVKRAYEIIHEILPLYEVTQTMKPLPKKSFWVRLLKPSWLWIITTVALFYFKPAFFNTTQAWWILSVTLLLLIGASRILDYFNSRYSINDRFIQFKTGSLETSVFVSKRDKIIEVNISRGKLQQFLGLASIGTVNHAKPVHHAGIDDIPVEIADNFYTWYAGRGSEIKIE